MTDETGDRPFWDLERYRSETIAPPRVAADGTRREQKLRMVYDGAAAVLFWTAFRSAFLTILTIGFHRFWMITRLRRFYWGAIRIDNDPLEYTGRGLEKLLGFLLALVFLAIYLGAVNITLAFVGFSYAANDPTALQAVLNISLVVTLPLIFYATYASHRYMLSRTRWRGIRFGLQPGAFGYMFRALGYSLLTAITLGLLYPYQHFKLVKYMTDRAWYGDLRFRQDGSWLELFSQWLWIYIILAIIGVLAWGFVENPENPAAYFFGTLAILFGGFVLLIFFFRYFVCAFRVFWNNRTLGEASFTNNVSTARVLGIYIGGTLATTVCAGLLTAGVGAIAYYAAFQVIDENAFLAALESEEQMLQIMSSAPILLAGLVTYLVFVALAIAFGQVFISQPVLRAQVAAMTVLNPAALSESQQREADAAAEAGGFADALGVDVGGGF
ncbi:MAG: DUF898 family protein [Paracoccaceae bacterium]